MANTLSTIKMTNPIRGLVSKRRIRYTKDGFDLDLTYINDRIIAMGYPAEHIESIYRNKIEDVQKMLEKNHAGCYKIYNLCSERSYNHKRFPYYSVYPFKDHNPPDIELITSFCRDVDEHLRADSKNVVAVHCKAGKGRTGTMICCYLLYSGQFNTAAEALHYYAQQRTSDSKGVTIPSQRRYVEYYATLLRSNETYQPVTLYICEIRIAPVLNFKEGTIIVSGKNPMQLPEFKRAADEQQQHVVAKLDYCMPLAGDVKVELVKSSVLRKEKRCHFWFNTYFVEKAARKDPEGNLLLELSKSEIDDAHKDKHHKEYPNNFMVALVMRRVPNGRFSDSVSMKTTSSLITCAMENNRQTHLYSQNQHQQMLLQQHHSPLQQQLLQQQQQQQHPPHRQIGSDLYRPALIKHHNSSPGGFLQHDQQQQQHHHQLQQHNSLPQQQNNHHNNHHPQQQQQQHQQNLTDKQQYFKAVHETSQQQQQQHNYVDDSHHHHCLEYSETSSSESSTEEEGWDSGECLAPDNANLYYRNDNYYYGSCAGLSSNPSGSMRPGPPAHAPASVHLQFPTRASSSTTPSGGGSKSNSQSDVTEPKTAAQPNHNDSCRSSGSSSSSSRSIGRRSSKTIGSSKLNQSLANTTFATSSASSSGKSPLVVPALDSAVSSGVLSSGSLTMQVSVPRLPMQTRPFSRNNNSYSNGSLPSSAASELTSKISPTSTIAVPSTNRNAWSSMGLKRKKKKSFKTNGSRNFALMSREFGSTASACSGASVGTQGKVKSGKGRFYKLPWLRNIRSDHKLKEVLAQSSDIMTLTHSTVTLRESAAAPVTLPIVVENPPNIPTVQPSTASNENLLSIDYYSSICDKQLSFESPCKSPGHLMKLNLARKPVAIGKTSPDAIPDSECAIVIAKPSEQRLKIGFDVSPTRSPTSKAVPNNPLTKTEAWRKNELDVDGKFTPKSLNLVPKQENASFCDRILQTLAAGMGSKKSSDQELQVPSPPTTSHGGSPISPRANRYSPFSFREVGQELKSVMQTSSQTKLAPLQNPPSPPTSDGNSTEEASLTTKQAEQ